ncbi:hypothetical protein D3C77_312910 [compost metagenome]
MADSTPRAKRLGEPCLSSLAATVGETVRATIAETATAAARVKANSLNKAPVSPPISPSGAYTATKVAAMVSTGPAISRAPFLAACKDDSPSSMRRWTFSTTTIASSTTRPMAKTMASSVSRLRLKPRASMIAAAPSSDSGMLSTGTATARMEPRKRKITSTTSRPAITNLSSTLSIAASMNTVTS